MDTFYRRKLPHWIPPGAVFFITFRLARSLPVHILQQLKKEREREREALHRRLRGRQLKRELYTLEKRFFGHFDAWLDRCLEGSPRWLADERIARIVAEAIHQLDGERYTLIAYCIMPNHVHLLIDTVGYTIEPGHRGATSSYPLTDTLKRLKGRTAHHCNQALGRRGAFWQHESYDHVVRNAEECERIVAYILNNPVKAGLVSEWEDWPFSWLVGRN
ncbi:MAG: transposase [Anaerolineae bacterium]|nr:transposase [Anaerolineae bacterium]